MKKQSRKSEKIHKSLRRKLIEKRIEKKTEYCVEDLFKLYRDKHEKRIDAYDEAHRKLEIAAKHNICPLCDLKLKTYTTSSNMGAGEIVHTYHSHYCPDRKCDFKVTTCKKYQ